MYQDIILDHYRFPQHSGLREPFDAEVHHVNPSCGDEITLRVRLGTDEAHTVEDISYAATGCSISQAAVSVLAEEVRGITLAEAWTKLSAFEEMITSRGAIAGDDEVIGDGVAFAGVAKYPARVKCALLGWLAFKEAAAAAVAAADGTGEGTISAPAGFKN